MALLPEANKNNLICTDCDKYKMEHAFYLVVLKSPAPETLLLSRKIPPSTWRTLGTIYLVLRGNGLSSMRESSNTSQDIRHEIATWSRTLKSPEHMW